MGGNLRYLNLKCIRISNSAVGGGRVIWGETSGEHLAFSVNVNLHFWQYIPPSTQSVLISLQKETNNKQLYQTMGYIGFPRVNSTNLFTKDNIGDSVTKLHFIAELILIICNII